MYSITKNLQSITIALAAVVLVAFAFAAQVKAADLDMFGSYVDSIDWTTPAMYDYGFDSYPSYVESIDYTTPAFYDYGSPSYVESIDYFSSPYYTSPAFYSSGFTNPGFSFAGMPLGGGNHQSQSQSQGQSQSQSSVNTNVNNNVITVNTPTTPVQQTPVCPTGTTGTYPNCVWPQPNCPAGTTGIYPNCIYPQPTYDICPNLPGIQQSVPAGYYLQNGYCVQHYVQPPVYPTYPTQQPYVTLSQVPYTGLEMGPVATVLYWSFLVLWCLFVAYLIAVKKVHNTFVAWLTGSKAAAHTAPVQRTHAATAPAPKAEASATFDGIDPFIASQIGR